MHKADKNTGARASAVDPPSDFWTNCPAWSVPVPPALPRLLPRVELQLEHHTTAQPGDRFLDETKYYVGIDDHVPVNERLRIPTIDIIEYNAGTSAFHPSWHTHDDNMNVIDPATLKAVGQTVLEVVWKER